MIGTVVIVTEAGNIFVEYVTSDIIEIIVAYDKRYSLRVRTLFGISKYSGTTI